MLGHGWIQRRSRGGRGRLRVRVPQRQLDGSPDVFIFIATGRSRLYTRYTVQKFIECMTSKVVHYIYGYTKGKGNT